MATPGSQAAPHVTLAQLRRESPDEGLDLMRRLEGSGILANAGLTGREDEYERRVTAAIHSLRAAGMPTLRPLLPLFLNLKGRPYTLDDHYPFEPFFRTLLPRSVLLKTGRQVSKSTSLAAQGVVFSNCMPYFSTLYVTPLYEMIRRFSQSYVRPFIETSPIRRLVTGRSTMNSVLQRTFKNHSQMFFSFAFLDAERVRGIPADRNVIDEVQHMNMDFLPIIHETMSGSPWRIRQYAGTPLSNDNTIQALWNDSSQAEWAIKCHHGGCGHWNIPALAHDLDAMFGPYRDDISEAEPGVVCAKCRKPLRPRDGRWLHGRPALRWDFAGYHVPQIVMPMHCADPERWGALLAKRAGKGNTTTNVFFNEVCGESFDAGSKVLTETDLKAAACLPWRNVLEEAKAQIGRYRFRLLAVDWGGGGTQGPGGKVIMSFTAMAALGMTPDGRIDVIWGYRSLTPHDHIREAKMCLGAMRELGLTHMAHDFGGAGTVRETVAVQAGLPYDRLIPIQLGRTSVRNILVHHPPDEQQPRDFYVVDKPRSLLLTCHGLKFGLIRTFEYDYKSNEDRGLLRDFLALLEEKLDSRFASDTYTIVRDPNHPDDFAQAVNLGCVALWHMSGMWPNIAAAARMQVSPEMMNIITPLRPTWEDA